MLAEAAFCTGCGSCVTICPYHCISMEVDCEGFLYPEVNFQKCIACRLCEKACPVLNGDSLKCSEKSTSYAVQNRNEDIRRKSSSGGVFMPLALSVIEQGGVICAAKYTDNFDVIHSITENRKDICAYCGAKYAQSKAEQCFDEIKDLLNRGRKVLFVGTPCQVAGLNAYLNYPYDNLLLVDMICHGVPSPLVWKKYLEERKRIDADGAELIAVDLRNKSTGWSRYSYSVRFDYKNGKSYSVQQEKDMFMKGFTANLYLRPSCSNCKFKGIERLSDITLGDYWGVWNLYPEFDDNIGTSLVLIHSKKGKKMWEHIQGEFRFFKISNEDAIQYNQSAIKESPASDRRTDFFDGLSQGQQVSDLVQFCLLAQNNKKMSIAQKILSKVFSRN